MKLKKFITMISVAAFAMTSFAVIPAPVAFADGGAAEEIGFFEDFEEYEEVSDTYTLVDAMNDLYADGWSVATDNQFTARNEGDANQNFAQVVKDGENKVLELTGLKALGIMLDPSSETPAGSYEVSFRFKPVDIGKKQMLFDLSLNSFNIAAADAKHNILYSYNGMKMGHRQNNVNVPLTQVGTPEEVWYDVKCIVNNDGGFYSVELYKDGEFVARRGCINYAGDEKIGFLKLGAFGTEIYVDDVSIKPCEQETLIYEDNFDSYKTVRLATTYAPIGSTVNLVQSREGESFFEGYTPWRALTALFDISNASKISTGENYDLVHDEILDSQVLKLGETANSSMILMPLDGELLTKESQAKRGKLKLSYKFRDYTNGTGLAVVLDFVSQYNYSGKWDYPPQFAVMEKTLGSPAVAGQPYLKTIGSPVKINQAIWYDAEIIFDVINDNVSVVVKEDASGKEIANFSHKTNWMSPEKAPTVEMVKAINFRALSGSATYIDDFKLEYYVSDPKITGSEIVITDYRGERATDRNNVPAALTSIKLPFGCEMTAASTNTESVTIRDSKGSYLSYSPVYGPDFYTIVPDGLLTPGETYTLTVPATLENTFGHKLGYDFEYSFKITSDYPELMTLTSISATELQDISNNSAVHVEIGYANSTDAPIESLLFAAFYGDGRMLATSSLKPDTVNVGESGVKTVTLSVPGAADLDMSKVDKISICLWKGFENSAPLCGETDLGDVPAAMLRAQNVPEDSSKPVITYSYSDSVLNISGNADTESEYLTVQIIKPGNTFAAGESMSCADADKIVFYRGQIPVTNGKYSLDIRFDEKGNTASTLEAGNYPTAIFLDDTKLDLDSVYLSSYSDFENVCNELNAAAASDDLAGFKNILNTKRAALNFNNELLGDAALGDEIKPYFEYVKKNPLKAENEVKNSQMFNTYVVIQRLNSNKIDNINDYVSDLMIDDDLKTLCGETLTTEEKGEYFTSFVSGKNTGEPEQLEKSLKEALILTTARYGNGYGELKEVLETCGSQIGIGTPVSAAACRALMGKSFSDVSSFKSAYDKSVAASQQSSSGSSSSSGGGASGSGGGKKTSMAPINVPVSEAENSGLSLTPLTTTFNDIDNYEWAMKGILALAERNIINGVSEDRFDPSRNITREEFAKILVGALGLSDSEYTGNIFSDASENDWFVRHINIAAKIGVVKGIGDGRFGTGNNITRQDMAVMLYNALKYRGVDARPDGFKFDDDAEIADYAKEAVYTLHGMGAINGVTETTFRPLGFATRAQAAKIVYSVFKMLQG